MKSTEDIPLNERAALSIKRLDISQRTKDVLERIEINTLGQLCEMGDKTFLKYRGLGPRALQEVAALVEASELPHNFNTVNICVPLNKVTTKALLRKAEELEQLARALRDRAAQQT